MEEVLTPETVEVVDIQFRPGQKIYFFDPQGLTLHTGDHVMIDTARGPEFGLVAGGNHTIPQKDVVSPLRVVLRVATAKDEKIMADNRAFEARAQALCMQKIAELKLDMQLVSVECAFDGSKLLFFFTADERVDFRELVKHLGSALHTRIELRQIGVRDKARMVGGLGICGLPFCCATFLEDFQPVSIKMAKTQNLSLNPTKISGTCGRLMCCLKYEQDAYEDLLRRSPKMDSFVDTPDGRGTVVDIDLLRQRVKVMLENEGETVVVNNDELAVLRSGKAKKTDAPIPADLAPVSGSGKRTRKPQPEEEAVKLESIRFKYSTDTVAEESVPAPQPEETEAEKPHRRRRSRKPRSEGNPAKQPAEAPAKEPKAEPAPKKEPKAEQPEGEKKEKRPHRPRHRRRSGGNKPDNA